MKYLYWDLGDQPEDSRVVVHLRGSAAKIQILPAGESQMAEEADHVLAGATA